MVDAHLRSKTIETADIKNLIIGGQTGIDGIRFCLAAVTNGENLADPAFSWFLQYKNKNGQGESVGLTPVYENGLVKLPWVPNKLATQVPGRMQIQLYAAIVTGEGEAAVVDKQWVSEFAIIYIQENINPDPIVATELTIFDQYLTMYQSYRDASVAAFQGISYIVNGEDFQTVLSLNNSIPAVAAMDESIPVVAGMSVSVPLVAGVKDEIPVLAPVVSQIEQLALIKDQIVSLEAEKLKVAAVEAKLAEIQAVHDKLTEIEGVYGKSTEIDALYAQLATIATKANQADLDAVKGPDWSNQSLVSLDIEKLNKEDNGKLFAYRHPRSPEEMDGTIIYSTGGASSVLGFYEKMSIKTVFNTIKFRAYSTDMSAQLEYRIFTRTAQEMAVDSGFIPSSLTPLATGYVKWDSQNFVTIRLEEVLSVEATDLIIILVKSTNFGAVVIYMFNANSPTLPNRHPYYLSLSGGWDGRVVLSSIYAYSQTAIELYLENETYRTLVERISEIDEQISDLNERADVLQDEISLLPPPSVEVVLPDTIYAVVGDKLQLFFRGMIKHPNPYVYDILVSCIKGKATPRYFEYTPTAEDVGTTSFKVEVRDHELRVLGSKTCNLITKGSVQSPSTMKHVLCVGDSLTSGGIWCAEASRRLIGAGGVPAGLGFQNIAFHGRKTNGVIGWEGTGGWDWSSFAGAGRPAYKFYVSGVVTSPSIGSTYSHNGLAYLIVEVNITEGVGYVSATGDSAPLSAGTLSISSGVGDASITFSSSEADSANPFWEADTGQLDFKQYVDVYMNGSCDVIYFLLSWNGQTAGRTDFTSMISTAKTLVNHIHSEYPNCQIKIMGLQLPSLNGGMGANYGATGTGYSDTYGMVITALNLNKAYQAWCNEVGYSEYMEFVSVSVQYDSENNMPESSKTVNTRSMKTELIGTNGVHPSNEGYYQIADAVYRNFVASFC